MKIFLSGGLGDILTLEATWDDEFRSHLREIHWGCTRERFGRELFHANPAYAHVEHQTLYDDWTRRGAVFSLDELRAEGVAASEDIEDWSVSEKFPEMEMGMLPHEGSSFLENTIAEVPMRPRKPYVLIQGDTPTNPRDHRLARRLGPEEWAWIGGELRRRDLMGVVVNQAGAEGPPESSGNFLDLTGRTSIPQSIELLKGARGYLGIDSFLSVLSCMLFRPEDILIRSVNRWWHAMRHVYCRPLRHKELEMVSRKKFGDRPLDTRGVTDAVRQPETTCA